MKDAKLFLVVAVVAFMTCQSPLAQDSPEKYSFSQALEKGGYKGKPTLSEEESESLRFTLALCWDYASHEKGYPPLAVDIHIVMNPDRTIKSAEAMDKTRYEHDTAFRAAADMAIGSLFTDVCSMSILPYDKYAIWKDLFVRYNPDSVKPLSN